MVEKGYLHTLVGRKGGGQSLSGGEGFPRAPLPPLTTVCVG